MNTLTDLLLGVGQPRVSHFPDLCTLLYTYLSTLDYWTKIVYYLFTQTSPVAHTSALTPTYIKSQKLPNWPISKELGLGRMLLPHWKLLFTVLCLRWLRESWWQPFCNWQHQRFCMTTTLRATSNKEKKNIVKLDRLHHFVVDVILQLSISMRALECTGRLFHSLLAQS